MERDRERRGEGKRRIPWRVEIDNIMLITITEKKKRRTGIRGKEVKNSSK